MMTEAIHYVIGDVHGEYKLLERMLEAIQSRHQWKTPDRDGVIVYLGDLVDRGPNSRRAIERARYGIDGFHNVFLKGNHEALMARCLETDDHSVWNTWLSAGGEATLRSFEYDVFHKGFNPEALRAALGERVVAWLGSLAPYYQFGDFLCVHAGLVPGIPLSDQREQDLLWIRNRFLHTESDFGYCVVHGHTPSDAPEVRPNRIGIDTGAGQGGELTALVIDRSWREVVEDPTFIQVS